MTIVLRALLLMATTLPFAVFANSDRPLTLCICGECEEMECDGEQGIGDLQGFGTQSTFGGGDDSEVCRVTNLNNSGDGSLRSCVNDRNGLTLSPTPRTIVFDVGGTITLTSDLSFNSPFMTVDGLSAPAPGITLAKTGNGEDGETRVYSRSGTCGHDVLIQGLRFKGVWSRNSESHSQNAGIMSVDGEDQKGCLKNVVLHRNTWIDGQDAAGQIWGSVVDLTLSHNLFAYNYHPQSISHWPGNEPGQERERFSIHHNVYAYAHERIPNIRGNVWDVNMVQNAFLNWDAFGFAGGYATRFRCRNGGCPLRINMTDNFYSSNNNNGNALLFDDGADRGQVYSANNIFPAQENERGEASSPFELNDGVSILSNADWRARIESGVGHPYPTAEEQAVLSELLNAMP